MREERQNKQGGFILKLIIFIIALILILNYFHLSMADVLNWIVKVIKGLAGFFSKQ